MPAPGDQHRNIANPFQENIPRISEYTAQEIATLQARLDRQLGPEYISSRAGPGGVKVHYLAAEKVINLANEVFGFNGWSSSIQNVQVDFVDEDHGKITMGCSIIVRVTLRDGTFHEDIGYGEIKNSPSKAAAFEKSKKEAATDGLKRALRNFGNVLGNCVYDKTYLSKVTKLRIQPSKWDVDNLHRHPDYAPAKRDMIKSDSNQAVESKVQQAANNQPDSLETMLNEYADVYGENEFDDMELINPDEVCLEGNLVNTAKGDSTANSKTEDQSTKGNAASAQNPKPRPMPTLRPNGASDLPDIRGRTSPRKAPPANQNQVHGRPVANDGSIQPVRTTSPKLPNLPPNSRSGQQQPGPVQVKGPQPQALPATPNSGNDGIQNSNDPSPSVGFFSAKAAQYFCRNDAANGPVPSHIPAFNPHAETPGMRRTSGFNHGTSAPVSRQVAALATGTDTSTGTTVVHITGNAEQTLPKTNFVNPQADTNRRIGMPAAAQSPMANRNAYKPPGQALGKRGPDAANRPPLSEVSNVQTNPVAVGNDVKRAKIEESEKR